MAPANDYSIDAFRRPGGNFPERRRRLLHRAGAHARAAVCRRRRRAACPPGPIPQAPGVGRNSFRGPALLQRRCDVEQGVRPAGHQRAWGRRRSSRSAPGFYNLFNKINLKNIQADILNEHFGEAQEGLAGRTIELQARFSF